MRRRMWWSDLIGWYLFPVKRFFPVGGEYCLAEGQSAAYPHHGYRYKDGRQEAGRLFQEAGRLLQRHGGIYREGTGVPSNI